MIDIIFIVIGLTYCANILFEKWNVWNWIEHHGSKSNSKIVYRLSNCRFCLMFWISVLWTLLICVLDGFYWYCLTVPFVTNGLIQLFKKNDL